MKAKTILLITIVGVQAVCCFLPPASSPSVMDGDEISRTDESDETNAKSDFQTPNLSQQSNETDHENEDAFTKLNGTVYDNKKELEKLVDRMRVMEQIILSNTQPVLLVKRFDQYNEGYHDFDGHYRNRLIYREDCKKEPCACNVNKKTVFCQYNTLRKIPAAQIFPAHTETVDLSHNLLTALNRDTFNSLPLIKHLRLHKNVFRGFPDGLLDSLTNLEVLTLNDNMLEFLPSTFFIKTINLTELDVSNNKLNHIESDSLTNLANLEILNLSNNKIKFVTEGTFDGLLNLHTLNLKNNRISSPNNAIFNNMGSLLNLNLGNNPQMAVSIPQDIFNNLANLEDFNLEQTGLTNIDWRLLQRNTKLKILKLDSNTIETLHPLLFHAHNQITQLSISNNKLNKILQSNFASLGQMKFLNLQNNNISEIEPKSFDAFTKLQQLDLSNNKIDQIPPRLFRNLTVLNTLKLQNNQMKVFEPTALSGLYQAREVHLGGNPYHCNCSMVFFSIWLMSNEGKVQQPKPVCSTPVDLEGVTVGDVVSSLNCKWVMARR